MCSLHKDRDTILQHMLDDRVNVRRSWGTVSPLKRLCSRAITESRIDFLTENTPEHIKDTLIKDEEMSRIGNTKSRLIKVVSGTMCHCWLPGNYRVTHYVFHPMWKDNSDDGPWVYYYPEHDRRTKENS